MQSLRGTFATRGILIVIGAVIAIAASAVTAVAVRAGTGGSTQTSVGAGAVAGPRDTITVVGEGTQNATPDNALISLGVSVRRPTAADAMNTANAEMTALLKAIKGQGVLDADIQTTGISIYQDQQYTVIGYRAGNTVNVKVHHIANVGTVIVAAQKAVGDDIQLNGINRRQHDPAEGCATGGHGGGFGPRQGVGQPRRASPRQSALGFGSHRWWVIVLAMRGWRPVRRRRWRAGAGRTGERYR